MPTFASSATLDGFNPFVLEGFNRSFDWGNPPDAFLGYMSVGDANPDNTHDVTLTLRSNWDAATMRFWGWQSSTINLTMTDADASTNRRINFLDLPDDTATLNLISTRIGALFGWGGSYTLNLGSGNHNYVRLGGDEDAGASTLSLADGGRIETLQSDADLSVVLNGNSRIFNMKLDHATYHVETGTGNVESYYSHNGVNTLRIGQGGLTQLAMSRSDGLAVAMQDIEVQGWLGTANIMNNNAVRLILGEGGGGMIRINTTADAYMETGTGWVGGVQFGQANDRLVIGTGGVNWAHGGMGDDSFVFTLIDTDRGARIAGGPGRDTADFSRLSQNLRIDLNEGDFQEVAGRSPGGDLVMGIVQLQSIEVLIGGSGNDNLTGDGFDNELRGGDGSDTLIGGAGDDFLFGGSGSADLRDMIFGGDGNDSIDGGRGNDELHGGDGNDTILGDFGSDTLIGNAGDDVLLGGVSADLLFGGPGNDFLNGGFGFDRMNGGTGADRFFHAGVADHASDWIQDYNAADGDLLVFGLAGATRAQFQVNFTTTPGAGAGDVDEAFVIYRPTGQIMWALIDGDAQTSINILIGGQVYDLLA